MEHESKFYRFLKPIIPGPLRPLVLKYQEMVSYLVFGVLTTLVNFVIYFPLARIVPYWAALIPAWIGAVVFAFFVNKAFVFEDEHWDRGSLIQQGLKFASMRLLSLGMEEVIMLLFVETLGLDETLTKLAAQVLVVILNYIFSKLLIFRKK